MPPRRLVFAVACSALIAGCSRSHGRIDTSEMGRPWPRSGTTCELSDTLRVEPLVSDSSAADAFAWGPNFQEDAWGWRRWQTWASEGSSVVPFAWLLTHRWALRIVHTLDQCRPDQVHHIRYEVLRDGALHQTQTFPDFADECPLAFHWWDHDPDAVGGRGSAKETFQVLARFRDLSFLSVPPSDLPPSRRAAWLRQTWRTKASFQVQIETTRGNFNLDLGGGL